MKAPSILFRCDGSVEIGLGHVVRCLALADELREIHSCRAAVAMRNGPLGYEMVQKKGYTVFDSPENGAPFDYAFWLKDVVDKVKPHALVLDVRDDLPVELVRSFRDLGVLIVTIDDPSQRRLAADLAFYPPVPQVRKMDWTGFTGKLYSGWEWVILRPEFGRRRQSAIRNRQSAIPRILVTMGGSDPAGLTLKAVEALDLLNEDFESVVALGPGFCHHEALQDLLARTRRRFDVRQNVSDMPDLMAQADLAVASFGVTAYELAAMGVPAIYSCLTEDHAESASVFQKEGIGISLGIYTEKSDGILAAQVKRLLSDKRLRISMTAHALHTTCGDGVSKIAQKIMHEVFKEDL